jgi:hypothetical protein
MLEEMKIENFKFQERIKQLESSGSSLLRLEEDKITLKLENEKVKRNYEKIVNESKGGDVQRDLLLEKIARMEKELSASCTELKGIVLPKLNI